MNPVASVDGVGARSPLDAHATGTNDRRLAVERVRPAYSQVAEQLRQLIVRGVVVPGERLPVEAEMAALFGVSRSTVREALRTLASQQLVVTKRGVNGGTFVAKPEADHMRLFLEGSLGLLAGAEVVSVDQMLEARALFEVPAARFAATRRSEEQLEALQHQLEGADHIVRVSHEYEDNEGFHAKLMECADNRLMQVMARPVFSVLRMRFVRTEAPATFWKQVADEHLGIFEAVRDQDADKAATLMAEHLEHLRGTYEHIDVLPHE